MHVRAALNTTIIHEDNGTRTIPKRRASHFVDQIQLHFRWKINTIRLFSNNVVLHYYIRTRKNYLPETQLNSNIGMNR